MSVVDGSRITGTLHVCPILPARPEWCGCGRFLFSSEVFWREIEIDGIFHSPIECGPQNPWAMRFWGP